jgi:hypothetical protein
MVSATVSASFLNSPGGGFVETVFIFRDHFLGVFVCFFADFFGEVFFFAVFFFGRLLLCHNRWTRNEIHLRTRRTRMKTCRLLANNGPHTAILRPISVRRPPFVDDIAARNSCATTSEPCQMKKRRWRRGAFTGEKRRSTSSTSSLRLGSQLDTGIHWQLTPETF